MLISCLQFVYSWVFGSVLCKAYHFITSLSYTASIFILVVICMERYLAIQHPITSKQILTSSRLKVSMCNSGKKHTNEKILNKERRNEGYVVGWWRTRLEMKMWLGLLARVKQRIKGKTIFIWISFPIHSFDPQGQKIIYCYYYHCALFVTLSLGSDIRTSLAIFHKTPFTKYIHILFISALQLTALIKITK